MNVSSEMGGSCEICNYTTESKYNYDRHIQSAKHKAVLLKDPKPNKDKCQFKCDGCPRTFNRQYNLDRHLENCTAKVLTNSNMEEKIKDMMAKMNIKNDYQNDLFNEMVTKVATEAATQAANQMVAQMGQMKMPSAVNQITSNVVSQCTLSTFLAVTKPEPIKIIPQKEMLKIINNYFHKNGNKNYVFNNDIFVGDIMNYFKRDELSKFLGDIIVAKYVKDDPRMQAIWSTNKKDIHYKIYYEVDGKLQWSDDKGGLITSQLIIAPLLKFVYGTLSNFVGRQADTRKSSSALCDEMLRRGEVVKIMDKIMRKADESRTDDMKLAEGDIAVKTNKYINIFLNFKSKGSVEKANS